MALPIIPTPNADLHELTLPNLGKRNALLNEFRRELEKATFAMLCPGNACRRFLGGALK